LILFAFIACQFWDYSIRQIYKKKERDKMNLYIGVYLVGKSEDEFQIDNPGFVPNVGEVFSYKAVASGSQEDPNIPKVIYKVLERQLQYTKVGGSEPAGSEDTCYVVLTCEEVPQKDVIPSNDPPQSDS
jgi:hypothetical protein